MTLSMIAFVQATMAADFQLFSDRKLETVALAGTFNGWDKRANPMKVLSDGKTWVVTLNLRPGKYAYKFVLNDSEWITDPKSKRNEDDGGGHTNSILLLLPKEFSNASKVGDGLITSGLIKYRPSLPDLNYDRGRLQFRIQTRPNDVSGVDLVANGKQVSLTRTMQTEFSETWTGSIAYRLDRDLRYSFVIVDGKKELIYGVDGIGSKKNFVIDSKNFKPFVVPSWVEKSVFYQIFPDRFENGDRSNDPKDVQAWRATPNYFSFKGGDLKGVQNRLSYLKQLGVDAVYFNPIFESPSNHRYDATDFYQVDHRLGTNQDLANLDSSMNKLGIKKVYDVSFNHSSTMFKPFLDLLAHQQDSGYKDWYFVKSFPVEVKENPPYVAWFNFPSMPKLNLANPDTKRYMLGLVDHWKKIAHPDGWRLDVANEIPDWFWQSIRTTVKAQTPNDWIVGEVWGDATHWLQGDQWDSAMNYPFREAVLQFVTAPVSSPTQLMNRLMEVYSWYPSQVSRNMLNSLSTHDTERIRSLCKGDSQAVGLAAVLLFTWVGAPCIYYGDELGMEGGRDPDNRRGMDWSLAVDSNQQLNLFKKLINIRHSSPALQGGEPELLLADDSKGILAFKRTLDREDALVAINASATSQTLLIPTPKLQSKQFINGLNGQLVTLSSRKEISLSLSPKSAAILVPATSKNRFLFRAQATPVRMQSIVSSIQELPS